MFGRIIDESQPLQSKIDLHKCVVCFLCTVIYQFFKRFDIIIIRVNVMSCACDIFGASFVVVCECDCEICSVVEVKVFGRRFAAKKVTRKCVHK